MLSDGSGLLAVSRGGLSSLKALPPSGLSLVGLPVVGSVSCTTTPEGGKDALSLGSPATRSVGSSGAAAVGRPAKPSVGAALGALVGGRLGVSATFWLLSPAPCFWTGERRKVGARVVGEGDLPFVVGGALPLMLSAFGPRTGERIDGGQG